MVCAVVLWITIKINALHEDHTWANQILSKIALTLSIGQNGNVSPVLLFVLFIKYMFLFKVLTVSNMP